ncbi:MAG TPA: NADH-quinone oxidoreductase subunit C, partial [Gaiellaceae bacterium]|nr:NADH-quinone oxidoreductase subunit C [Gaiellaceae bacterium]
MSLTETPGLVEVKDAVGETTIVVAPEQLVAAATHLRDAEGFNFLSDITAVDYLGWGSEGVSGYIGTASGRNINTPMTQGYGATPAPKPKR